MAQRALALVSKKLDAVIMQEREKGIALEQIKLNSVKTLEYLVATLTTMNCSCST